MPPTCLPTVSKKLKIRMIVIGAQFPGTIVKPMRKQSPGKAINVQIKTIHSAIIGPLASAKDLLSWWNISPAGDLFTLSCFSIAIPELPVNSDCPFVNSDLFNKLSFVD